MVIDLSQQLIQATVQLEQPLGNGTRTVGTGFLISEVTPDGRAHTILVTANHVFDKMPKGDYRVMVGSSSRQIELSGIFSVR